MVASHNRIQFGTPPKDDDLRRIAFVGLDRAGKTTTLKRFSRGILVSTKPTHGFNTESFTFLGLRFNVFDLGGQVSYQIFWEKFIPQQEAVVFFIDAADTRRLPDARIALNKTLRLVKDGTTIMVLANKQDLPNALKLPDLMKSLDLRLAPKAKQMQMFEVSAKTGVGLYDAFQWLASAINADMPQQKCTLYSFYVYEKNVGIPLVASDFEKSLMNVDNPLISHDPSLITALHSALANFANEMAESELTTVKAKSRKTGQVFQIASVRIKNLVAVLVTSEGDNEVITNALGEAILDLVHEKMDGTKLELNKVKNLQLDQIIDIIAPFIRNAEELKQHISTQRALSPPEPEPKPERKPEPDPDVFVPRETIIPPKPSYDRIRASPEEEVPAEENSAPRETPIPATEPVKPSWSPPSEDSPSTEPTRPSWSPPSEDSPSTEPTRPSWSPPPNEDPPAPIPLTDYKKKDDGDDKDDDMVVFHMSVAERIKRLQEKRRRLREE
ncbi:MAG: ADP-ribosylation factor-like protein [Candidatus Hermodarchaeota archaeon]